MLLAKKNADYLQYVFENKIKTQDNISNFDPFISIFIKMFDDLERSRAVRVNVKKLKASITNILNSKHGQLYEPMVYELTCAGLQLIKQNNKHSTKLIDDFVNILAESDELIYQQTALVMQILSKKEKNKIPKKLDDFLHKCDQPAKNLVEIQQVLSLYGFYSKIIKTDLEKYIDQDPQNPALLMALSSVTKATDAELHPKALELASKLQHQEALSLYKLANDLQNLYTHFYHDDYFDDDGYFDGHFDDDDGYFDKIEQMDELIRSLDFSESKNTPSSSDLKIDKLKKLLPESGNMDMSFENVLKKLLE